MLLEGEGESAARGLLAAFAWSAPDIGAMTSVAGVLGMVADVLHWHGHTVLVYSVGRKSPVVLECVLVRAVDGREAPPAKAGEAAADLLRAVEAGPLPHAEGDGVTCAIRVGARIEWLLVASGVRLTRSAIDAVDAFARLAGTTLGRIADREAREADRLREEARARSTIASERLTVLGEAAAVLAHEMRNPLCTISNAVALLDRADPTGHPVARSIIRDEVGRLDALVQDLLQLARPVDPSCRRVELGKLIRATLERAQKDLGSTHVLVLPKSPADDVEVTGDPALLSLALENLVRNAAQASPPDSEIRVLVESQSREVTISVEDDGPGVATAMQERIFEPFFTTRAVGTGLGLAIVKRLVEAHGGSVRVGSSLSGGARFDLVFARAT